MLDNDKILVADRLCLLQPSKELALEPGRHAELALLGSLAAAALNEGHRRLSAAGLAETPLRQTPYLLDLSETQYTALQQVGGAVMVVVNDQRVIIARTAADDYTAYAATR
jgi:hypothetical protein